MLFRTGLRQTLRAPVRLIASFLVIALVSAFLCIDLNLYLGAEENAKKIYDGFHVIATPEIFAERSETGNFIPDKNAYEIQHATDPQNRYAGYLPFYADDYDLSPIKSAAGVLSIDARGRYGVFVPDAVTFAGGMDSTDKTDTIVFTVTSPAPVRLDPVYATDDATSVPMRVLQSARGINPAFFPDRIKIANQLYGDSNLLRSYFGSHAQDSGSPVAPDGTIVLLPNTTYIATVDLSHSFLYANENYRAEDLSFTITQDSFHRITCNTSVLGNGQWSRGILERATEYLPIAPYSPGIWDTTQGDFFKTAAEGAGISAHSLMAVTTRDLMSILPFSSGDVYITQGRGLNQEDLAGKAKVCLVSEALAELNGYQLGDKLPMSFYKSEFIYSPYVSTLSPVFNQDSGGFFDEGTFEIVGFYGGNVTTAMDPDSSTQYKRDNGVFMTELFVPEGSAENTPPVRVCPFDTSIQLEPTQVQAFTAYITAKGLT